MVSKHTCNLNTFCVLTAKASRAKIWYISHSPVACLLLSILRRWICLNDSLFIFLLITVYCLLPLFVGVLCLAPCFAIQYFVS